MTKMVTNYKVKMNINHYRIISRCLVVAFSMWLCMPVCSYGQGTVIVRPPKKAGTKTEVVKPKPPKKSNDKNPQTPAKPQKPSRTVAPAIVHSQQWAVDRILDNMVKVDGGHLMMGDPNGAKEDTSADNVPVHEVILSPYYIGRYEVTEEEWQLIMGNNPSDKANGLVVSKSCPVDNVSWEECQQFISKISQLTGRNFRLPTEAEWEFAAKGDSPTEWQYAGGTDIDEYGWFVGNSSRVKHPVGQKRPNALGLYDMTGNVREWCQDFYQKDYYAQSPETDPQGPEQGTRHVIRGGSFNNQDEACTVTYRSYSTPDNKNKFTGLRLAYSAE